MPKKPLRLSLKCIVLGDPAVGKTSLVSQFVHEYFKHSYKKTIGLDVFIKRILVPKVGMVFLNINDIGGQEIFSKYRQKFFEGASLVVYVYDLTRPESLENIEKTWYPEFSKYAQSSGKGDRLKSILIGNKSDLTDLIMVDQKEGDAVKDSISALDHIITSAKDNDNVDVAFQKLTTEFLSSYLKK